MATRTPEFQEGDHVLCKWREVLYPAKVLKKNKEGREIKYSVHYERYNGRWDETVLGERLYEINDDNLKVQSRPISRCISCSGLGT